MKYAEQISAFETKRAALIAGNDAIMEKAAGEGATLDAAQKEEYDGNAEDISEIDDHLKRLRVAEKSAADTAKPADGTDERTAAASRNNGERIQVRAQPKLEPGIAFARLAKCYGMAKGNVDQAARIAEHRYGAESDAFGTLKHASKIGLMAIEKAEVPAGSTVSGSWAEDLVGAETSAFADFVEYLRPQTILGKFGTGGIPNLRRVPFRVALVSQTAGGDGYWVGEGKAKPLTSFDFSRTTLTPLKVANICVLTDEVIRDSSPSAEMIVRDELVNALKARLDIDFVDTTNSGSSGVKPASITNGADSIAASAGGDADDIRLDVRSMIQKYINANNPPSSGVFLMSAGDALALSMLVNALGQPEFTGIGMNGGVFFGMPVITSEHMGSGIIALINASDIYLADEGGIRLDMSREASVEMLDGSLTGDSIGVVPGTAASTVSLWQTNSVGFLAERTINWARRRATAVTYLTGAAWGGAVNT